MSNIRVETTQNISLDFELGSLGDRILGWLIDWLVIITYGLFIFLVLLTTDGFGIFDTAPWLYLLIILPVVFYDLVMEISFNGQSLGKKAVGIRVVSLDGRQPSLGQYLIRWLFRLVDFTLTWSLCALVSVAVSIKHQRLGDLVGGTSVIKLKPRTSIANTLYVPVRDDYSVRFPEAVNLQTADVQLIKEVLYYYSVTGNGLILHQAAEKIRETLHIEAPVDPGSLLQTVIEDYNYLESRG